VVSRPELSLHLRPDATGRLARQTIGDYELATPDRARGRLLLSWWGDDPNPLSDPALVEKAILVAQHSPQPVVVGLAGLAGAFGSYRWRGLSSHDGPLLGVLAERRAIAAAAGRRPVLWRAFPATTGGGVSAVPAFPAAPRVSLEWLLRRRPARGAADPAQESWAPPGTTEVWLADTDRGIALTVGRRPADARRVVLLGRAFTEPFWRTTPLTRDPSGRGLVIGGAGTAVCFALTAGLPGMVEMHVAIETTRSSWPVGIADSLPALLIGDSPAWVDVPNLPPSGIW
jgi:hypothetical protein